MKRLTKRIAGGVIAQAWAEDILDRLAAYEDLGMTPEEIRSELFVLGRYTAEFGSPPPLRMKEIIDAEDEGRLVMLTCKVGDNVYQEYAGQVYESTITRIIIRQNAPILYDTDRGFAFNDHAIGRSVFLNRWEAERALEGNTP